MKKILSVIMVIALLAMSAVALADGNRQGGIPGGMPPQGQTGGPMMGGPNGGNRPDWQMPNGQTPSGEKPSGAPELPSGEKPADLPEVRWLDIKNTVIPSFACLAGMPKLDTLCIYASECLDYAGLEALQELKTIYCTQAQAEAIAARYPDRHWTLNRN